MTIETVVRFVVRFAAVFVLAAHWTYRAGKATGRFVHWLNDTLAAAWRDPAKAADRAIAWAMATMAEPDEPGLIETLGAALLTDEQLEAEIAAHNERVMPGIAEMLAQNCAEMAASDARLYRAAGERITAIRSILDEAEAVAEPAPAKSKRVARRKPVTAPAKPKRTARQKPAEAPKAETEA